MCHVAKLTGVTTADSTGRTTCPDENAGSGDVSATSAENPAVGLLVAVNLGRAEPSPAIRRPSAGDPRWPESGIDKRPVEGPVSVRRLGVAGDTICDTDNHGGPDQAVYAYAAEDAAWWQAELGSEFTRPLSPGSFGENLTLRGIDITGAVIGERWRIGSVILQVSTSRFPCKTFAGFWGVPQLVKRFVEAGRPGAYLRVLTEGELSAGDPVTVLDRPGHGLTVAETLRAQAGDRELVEKLLSAPELSERLTRRARRWLAAAG